MKLHNRQIKGEFWTDTQLQFDVKGMCRLLFLGLIQIADDSGCLEDDVRSFKLLLFPADDEMSLAVITAFKDDLVRIGKLIPYIADNKHCLFIKNFHKHQALRSPNKPDTPLPSWVSWVPSQEVRRSGHYEVSAIPIETQNDVRSLYGDRTVTVCGSSSSSSSSSILNSRSSSDKLINNNISENRKQTKSYTSEFEEWYGGYVKQVGKGAAFKAWNGRLAEGVTIETLTTARDNYMAHVRAMRTDYQYIKHPSTFLGRNDGFEDWIKPKVIQVSFDDGGTFGAMQRVMKQAEAEEAAAREQTGD